MTTPDFRGSRKHVWDWVRSPDFLVDLNTLLSPAGAGVTREDSFHPRPDDHREVELTQFGPAALPDVEWERLFDWWLVHRRGATTPTWDFIATCSFERRRGLVLIEAKANVPELSRAGKTLKGKVKDGVPTSPSQRSSENHEHIAKAIQTAQNDLAQRVPGVAITIRQSYQLANRIAFAWKLAELGVPCVLLYLGFTGDMGISYVGEPIRDDAHWARVFADYIAGVYPRTHVGRPIHCGEAHFHIMSASRPVRSQSTRPERAKRVARSGSEPDGR